MLLQFLAVHRDEIVRRCRAEAMLRSVPAAAIAVIDRGVPLFLDQMAHALGRGRESNPGILRSAMQHGHDLRQQGFSVSEVVHTYGDVFQAITQLALHTGAAIGAEDLRALNRCLGDAIAGAVTEYGHERTESALSDEIARGSEKLGFLAHELRNLINTGLMAFEVLKTGNVGVMGSTGSVLQRSLLGSRALISRSLAELRLAQGVQHPEQFLVSGFIDELAPAAKLEAETRRVDLSVLPVADGVAIEADRQVLAAVVMNLLQNAFKFTRPRTTVTLRVGPSAERVLIQVQDECGGLAIGNVDALFQPFEQRSVDRSGVGLGLAFSRWGVEANNGRIYAQSLPDKGCVFTIDLPRVPISAAAPV
jgi:signal transduction histidine kinase